MAASTSLLIGVLVSVSEVCRHAAALNAFCMHTLSNPASYPVKQEARTIKLKPSQVQASASDQHSWAQAVVLVALGAASLSLWGVGASSPLRQNALDFLHIKAIGAPATLLLMVAQVGPGD